jgi:hypothetical protein
MCVSFKLTVTFEPNLDNECLLLYNTCTLDSCTSPAECTRFAKSVVILIIKGLNYTEGENSWALRRRLIQVLHSHGQSIIIPPLTTATQSLQPRFVFEKAATMHIRGRPRQRLSQQHSLRPQGASEGPLRTPTSHFDAHAGKDSYVVGVVPAEVFRFGVPHYQIRWEGLPSGSNALERVSHLQDAASQAVIHAYLKSRSCDDENGVYRDATEESAYVVVPLSLTSTSKSSASVGEGVSLSGLPITVDEDEDGRIEMKHARVSSVW